MNLYVKNNIDIDCVDVLNITDDLVVDIVRIPLACWSARISSLFDVPNFTRACQLVTSSFSDAACQLVTSSFSDVYPASPSLPASNS